MLLDPSAALTPSTQRWVAYSPLAPWDRSLSFHRGPLPGEPTDGTFEVAAGARVHYVDRGSGDPVVLLHGFGSSLDVWSRLIPPLAREHRVVAVDLKGFGWTDRPEGDYSPRAQAQLVWELLKKRGVERASLVGHSWGASVALAMALSGPERTTRIVLYDAWAYEAQLSFAFRWSRSIGVGEVLLRLYDSNWAQSHLALGFYKPGQVAPELAKKLKARMDQPGARAAALATLRGMHFFEQQARYNTVRRPALVLWGQEDSIAGPAFGRRLAADLSGELVVFPRCGHFPMIEATEASTAVLQSFLRRQPKFA